MGRQVKIDCPRLPVPYTYTGNSIYHSGSDADRGVSAMGQRRTGERDCRGLRKKSPRVEQAGEKKNLDCTVPYGSRVMSIFTNC